MVEDEVDRRSFLSTTSGAVLGGALSTEAVDEGQALSLRPTDTGRSQQSTDTWQQFGYNAANTGYAPGNTGPTGNVSEAWSFPEYTEVCGPPTAVNGTLYVGLEGGLVALDKDDGTVDWEFEALTSFTLPGRSDLSPAVANGRVFTGRSSGLYALDAETGEQEWQFAPEDAVWSSPVVANGTVYIGNGNGRLYAVDAATGQEQWQFEDNSDGRIWNPPVVAGETVYVSTGEIIAVDVETGDEQWRFDPDNDGVVGSPLTVEGGAVYATGSSITTYAVDAETGEEQWRYTVEDGRAEQLLTEKPAVANGTVYISANPGIYAIDATTGEKQWQYKGGGTPAVHDGTVYAGGPSGLDAIDADTGDEEWIFVKPQRDVGFTIPSSPVIEDGTVYAGASNLYAVDTASGDEQWRFETGNAASTTPVITNDAVYLRTDLALLALARDSGDEQWRFEDVNLISSTPAVVDDTVYTTTSRSGFTALDTKTGDEQWGVEFDDELSSPPAVANGTVYVDGKETLYALDADTGDEQWRFEASSNFEDSSTPAVADGTVYLAELGAGLYAIDAATGEEQWQFDTSISLSAPAVADGTVYAGDSEVGTLYAVDAETGEEQWRFEAADSIDGLPAVGENLVYVDDAEGFDDGGLYAVDAETGEEQWRFQKTPTQIFSQSRPVVADGTVYLANSRKYLFGDRNKNLYAVDAETGEEQWQFEAGGLMALPAVADGMVYVVSQDGKLYALSGDQESPSVDDYANENGVVDTQGVQTAIGDLQTGDIGPQLLRDVMAAWQAGMSSS